MVPVPFTHVAKKAFPVLNNHLVITHVSFCQETATHDNSNHDQSNNCHESNSQELSNHQLTHAPLIPHERVTIIHEERTPVWFHVPRDNHVALFHVKRLSPVNDFHVFTNPVLSDPVTWEVFHVILLHDTLFHVITLLLPDQRLFHVAALWVDQEIVLLLAPVLCKVLPTGTTDHESCDQVSKTPVACAQTKEESKKAITNIRWIEKTTTNAEKSFTWEISLFNQYVAIMFAL